MHCLRLFQARQDRGGAAPATQGGDADRVPHVLHAEVLVQKTIAEKFRIDDAVRENYSSGSSRSSIRE